VKARDRLVVAAGAVLLTLALVASASAKVDAHRRHVEIRRPTSRAILSLGEVDGLEVGVIFEEPDHAILLVTTFDQETQAGASTGYGAHFHGSLPGGRLTARFGAIGSISVRFRPDGKGRSGRRAKNCQGRRPRAEDGSFVGRISLRGEDDYFHVSARTASAYLDRTFRLRCDVKRQSPDYPSESLREAVEPGIGFTLGTGGGSLATLEVGAREGGRRVGLRAAHMAGAPPGAEVQAVEFEYQGDMPVGRGAWAPKSPPGTLVTSLPGEHPPTAVLRPAEPFSGEGEYLASSRTSHSWSGDLSVQFPGLLQPLTGPDFYSTLCVVSPLRDPTGCDFVAPDWQVAQPSAGRAGSAPRAGA
jgi:hypothetical protein